MDTPRDFSIPPETPRDLRVTCAPLLGDRVAAEVEALGLPVRRIERTGVETTGTLVDIMRLNLESRVGLHVLEPLAEFACRDAEMLHRRLAGMPWERIIPVDGYLSVVSKVDTPAIDNSMFANMKVKDAIVDRISAREGRRPDSGPERDKCVVHLLWMGQEATIALDTSGTKLSDRSYRRRPHLAPMRETLAAAVLLEAGYDGSAPLVLPMCGSGTLAIEAALIATKRAPGLLRSNFGFMHALGFQEQVWSDLRHAARKVGRKSRRPAPIVANDIDPDAIEAARANAMTAGVDHLIDFSVCDFAETPMPDPAEGGLIVMNPEYGLRLGEKQALEETYSRMGDFFKQRGAGYTGYVFTGNPDLAKKIGLRTSRRVPFFNSRIECRLLGYELYAGTRRVPS